MAASVPPLSRKPSTPWDRLRPVKQDPLESMGFVSKGDSRLLDPKAQESYYHKIVARYMQFCTHHGKDLESAFATLSIEASPSPSTDPAGNPPNVAFTSSTGQQITPSPPKRISSQQHAGLNSQSPPKPSSELTIILLALRKLREALLASSSTAASPVFSQRVHVFSIRLAILALHPPSYYPSLLHLLFILHTPSHPLSPPELSEMTAYLILDLACRQNEFASAYSLRSDSKLRHGFESDDVDAILRAVITRNWVLFWKVRRQVDGYVRAVMQWAVDGVRRDTLKALGRSYMSCDVRWILRSASGGELEWEKLVEKENIGWVRDGEQVIIRKPKTKAIPSETHARNAAA